MCPEYGLDYSVTLRLFDDANFTNELDSNGNECEIGHPLLFNENFDLDPGAHKSHGCASTCSPISEECTLTTMRVHHHASS